MTDTVKKTFEEKAHEYMHAVIDEMRDLVNRTGDYSDIEEGEETFHWLDYEVLEYEYVWRGWNKEEAELQEAIITLATGGPAYGLRVDTNYNIQFWYQDWFKSKYYIDMTTEESEPFEDACCYIIDSQLYA